MPLAAHQNNRKAANDGYYAAPYVLSFIGAKTTEKQGTETPWQGSALFQGLILLPSVGTSSGSPRFSLSTAQSVVLSLRSAVLSLSRSAGIVSIGRSLCSAVAVSLIATKGAFCFSGRSLPKTSLSSGAIIGNTVAFPVASTFTIAAAAAGGRGTSTAGAAAAQATPHGNYGGNVSASAEGATK